MANKPKPVDWEAVRVEFSAGILTTTQIGKNHGISHTAVQKRAKAEGWTRDLSKRIDAAREAKVSRANVSLKVSKQREATDAQVVEATSNMQADVILSHRQDIQALKKTVVSLSGELGALADKSLQEALELVLDEAVDKASAAYKTALVKAFNTAMALGGRTTAVRNLVGALAQLIEKERQAFGIDKTETGKKSFPEWLDGI